MLSVYPRLFGVFGPSFRKLPEYSKYCKVSISQPSYGFYSRSNKAWFPFKCFVQSILLLWSIFFCWIVSIYVESHFINQSKKKKKFAYFLMEKGIWQKKQVIDHKVKIFHDRFDWSLDFGFFINMHAQIEKLIWCQMWSWRLSLTFCVYTQPICI